jgi:hypothetical protein
MRYWCAVALVVFLGWPEASSAAEPPALAKARVLYNAGSYDAAIESARQARGDEQFADAAALVIGRAHLERYRLQAEPGDLETAREMLGSVRRVALSPRDQVDLLIGQVQTLYFGEIFGAGAELLHTALAQGEMLSPRDRTRLLDWWASALEREAQTRSAERRAALFGRIAARMEEELAVEPASPVANYWLPAAVRGEGDLERAWDLAQAAWVRARLAPESTDSLRADLERLVTEALIPERARTRPQRDEAISALRAEWETLKQTYK